MVDFNFTNAATGGLQGFGMGASTMIPHMAGFGAAAGFVLGGLTGPSGGPEKSKKAQKRKKYVRMANKLQIQQQALNHALLQQQNDTAFKLLKDQNKQIARDQYQAYQDQIAARQRVYNDAVKIYKKSVDRGYEDFNLADIQSTMAMNDINRVRNDRITEIALKHQQMLDETEAANLVSFYSDKTLNRDSTLLDKAYSQATGYEKAALKNALTDTQQDFRTLKQQIKSAKAESKLQLIDLNRQAENATASANLAKSELALSRDEKRAQAAFETQKLRMEGLKAEGQTLATGQSGRSAAKLAQADRFASASAQNMIAAAMTRADAKYSLDVSQIAQQLRDSRLSVENQVAGIAQSMRNLKGEAKISKAKLLNRFAATKLASNDRLANLNLKLLQDQTKIYEQKHRNKIERFGRAMQLKINLKGLSSSVASLEDQYSADVDYQRLQKFFANRSIADQILPAPEVPDAISPPTALPSIVKQPMMPFDAKTARDLYKQADRAAMPYQPSAANNFVNSISSIGSEAFSLMDNLSKLKAPNPMTQSDSYTAGINFGSLFQPADTFKPGSVFNFGQSIDTSGINFGALDYNTPVAFGMN